MRVETPRYPVDRYLVESSNKVEMVNIIDDDIWNQEPALRPEDEIILRKLHEMLQSTADDLKLLSGELSKYHEPGVQIKTQPTPLDEEFNEKVHIEELVNAKFHGYKIVDNSPVFMSKPKYKSETGIGHSINNLSSAKVNSGVQVNTVPILQKLSTCKKLGMSRTKIIQINEKKQDDAKARLNNSKVINNSPAVSYNEFCFKYVEPKDNIKAKRNLQMQNMPSINIRSELTEQKVLHLDILPVNKENKEEPVCNSNVAVIALQYEPVNEKPIVTNNQECPQICVRNIHKPARKISRMSTCESSESTNNVSSDTKNKLKLQKQIRNAIIRTSPKHSCRSEVSRSKKNAASTKEKEKKQLFNLDEWKKKLNVVYGQPSTSRKNKMSNKSKHSIKKKSPSKINKSSSNLNNAEYIPYSHLTLGGVRISDIEKEISDIPNKNEVMLSPILDKILSSRENSFHKDSSKKSKSKDSLKILTTSDENLLQEVIDIEKTVAKTLSKELKQADKLKSPCISIVTNDDNDADSYPDDFEDEKNESDVSEKSSKPKQSDSEHKTDESDSESNIEEISQRDPTKPEPEDPDKNVYNTTYTKKPNLSFKNKVDIFEFVHSVDTQDIATQSTTSEKITLKETQTSPRNDRTNIQPIHNDLWSTIDSKGELERMLKLEKDFIKKLIIEEYGDLLEKNINKPSTSRDRELQNTENNVILFQKNTQTSPAHVKSVMTSPTRTKTRTTSPFTLSVPVDRQTSPMICVTSEEEVKLEIETGAENNGISINLSSPRFSLRLPHTSTDILSNIQEPKETPVKVVQKEEYKTNHENMYRKFTTSSSSSVDADNSSSEISSLGEIKLKLKRRGKKNRLFSLSDSSSSSMMSRYSDLQSLGILPLKSEGEVSLGQTNSRKPRKNNGSDGEMSIGRTS